MPTFLYEDREDTEIYYRVPEDREERANGEK